jgi:Fungal specific transcription factor domain
MTSYYETPDDQKDMWHWMGVTLSLAQSIGLHRDPQDAKMELKKKALWKRVWWMCVLRDRLICLGMRRPMRIKDDDFDVPMLALEDFDFQTLPSRICKMLGSCPLLSEYGSMKQLAVMCIEKVKLAVCIGNVLKTQYSVYGNKSGRTTETTMMLVPKIEEPDRSQVEMCQRELENWHDRLPPQAQYQFKDLTSLPRTAEVIIVHRAILSMMYLAVCSTLHRPQYLPSSASSSTEDLQDQMRRKARNVAGEITQIAHSLQNMNLARYLPITGVTVLLRAIIFHLMDMKAKETEVQTAAAQRYHQCMEVLRRLRDIYASADYAISFLEAATYRANIKIPSQRRSSRPSSCNREQSISNTLTPPPEMNSSNLFVTTPLSAGGLNFFAGAGPTPPASDGTYGSATPLDTNLTMFSNAVTDNDFDALFDFDTGAEFLAGDETIRGASSIGNGTGEVDFINGFETFETWNLTETKA